MFRYKTMIHMSDTDMTGSLYFTQQFRLAMEAFEAFLKRRDISLYQILQEGKYLFPIVHAEGDFFEPVALGDAIEVHLQITKIGTSSFTSKATFFNSAGQKMGETSIVQVVINKKTKASMPIPETFLKILNMEKSE